MNFRFLFLLTYKKMLNQADLTEFQPHISKIEKLDPGKASMRLSVILRPIMIRRTKASKLNGIPILTLPTKHLDVQDVSFSLEERDIYNA